MIQKSVENLLLSEMPAQTFEAFSSNGEIVPLTSGADLSLPDTPIRHCWFPLAGLVSVIAMDTDGNEAEVGMVGREGLVSQEVIFGAEVSTSRSLVQIEGSALRIKRELLVAELQTSRVFNSQMLTYLHGQTVELGEAALAYSRYTIEKRLARWLLIASDRTNSDELPLTHESLGIMLGVRRAGVTVSLHKIMNLGAITLKRGVIVISDRQTLEQVAGASYRPNPFTKSKSKLGARRPGGSVSSIHPAR